MERRRTVINATELRPANSNLAARVAKTSVREHITNLVASVETAMKLANGYRDLYATATNNLAVAVARYTSAEARAERAEARRNALIAWAEEQRDAAILPTTKAIWNSFIDRIKQEDDDNDNK